MPDAVEVAQLTVLMQTQASSIILLIVIICIMLESGKVQF